MRVLQNPGNVFALSFLLFVSWLYKSRFKELPAKNGCWMEGRMVEGGGTGGTGGWVIGVGVSVVDSTTRLA